ncbi:hypothetical protein ACHAWX_006220 [Stephanocyclus meneghinianus]
MALSTSQSKNGGTLRKRSTAPLNYIDGTDEDVAVVNGGKALSIPLNGINGGSASVSNANSYEAIQYILTKMIPYATLSALLVTLLTKYLSNFSTPAAQAVKLVYAGAIAGIISRTFCAPIEMVSTVMMCRGDECSTMMDELSKTWHKEGFKGMFKGNGANCLKVAPSRGTQFLVYEFVKRRMLLAGIGLAASSGSLHAGARLFAGGVAGMIAAAIVYPLEVVKTMLTLYPERCSSIPSALKMVYESSGMRGLYRGLGPTLVAMFPYVGVEFMVYETLKKRWEMHIGPVGTLALLLLGATGGAAAQASAHPLDVIRRRMQMQSMVGVKKDDDGEEKRYKNMFSGLYQVGKKEGVHVLFKGIGPACFEKIPSTAIGYFIYEFLKVTLKVSSV